jgi:hypothetical protein
MAQQPLVLAVEVLVLIGVMVVLVWAVQAVVVHMALLEAQTLVAVVAEELSFLVLVLLAQMVVQALLLLPIQIPSLPQL